MILILQHPDPRRSHAAPDAAGSAWQPREFHRAAGRMSATMPEAHSNCFHCGEPLRRPQRTVGEIAGRGRCRCAVRAAGRPPS